MNNMSMHKSLRKIELILIAFSSINKVKYKKNENSFKKKMVNFNNLLSDFISVKKNEQLILNKFKQKPHKQ